MNLRELPASIDGFGPVTPFGGVNGTPAVVMRAATRVCRPMAHATRCCDLRPHPQCPIDISQEKVDFVVRVDSIGDPQGILSGTTRPTTDPLGLQIAQTAANVIAASGLLCDGFSFQTGAGGVSIATSLYVKALMQERKVRAASVRVASPATSSTCSRPASFARCSTCSAST
jgi:hypothetical protein